RGGTGAEKDGAHEYPAGGIGHADRGAKVLEIHARRSRARLASSREEKQQREGDHRETRSREPPSNWGHHPDNLLRVCGPRTRCTAWNGRVPDGPGEDPPHGPIAGPRTTWQGIFSALQLDWVHPPYEGRDHHPAVRPIRSYAARTRRW